jgi:hypothetical protein
MSGGPSTNNTHAPRTVAGCGTRPSRVPATAERDSDPPAQLLAALRLLRDRPAGERAGGVVIDLTPRRR